MKLISKIKYLPGYFDQNKNQTYLFFLFKIFNTFDQFILSLPG